MGLPPGHANFGIGTLDGKSIAAHVLADSHKSCRPAARGLAGCGCDAGDLISGRLRLGRVDLVLSDRRRGRRRRPPPKHLGCVQPYARQGEARRHRRCGLRPLSPLAGGSRPTGPRRVQRLPVFYRLAAHPACRQRRGRTARSRFLRPPGGRFSRARRHAVALPLSLGSAAAVARFRRLAQSRYRRQVRRLRAHRGAAALRSRQALGDVQ